MEYTIEFDEVKELCNVHVTGRVKRPEDSQVLQKLARDLGIEHGCQRFLYDMRQAEIIGGTLETYTVGTVPVDTDHTQMRQRIALVYAGDLTDPKFMETVAVNRGYQVRVFDNLENALEWLGPKKNDS